MPSLAIINEWPAGMFTAGHICRRKVKQENGTEINRKQSAKERKDTQENQSNSPPRKFKRFLFFSF